MISSLLKVACDLMFVMSVAVISEGKATWDILLLVFRIRFLSNVKLLLPVVCFGRFADGFVIFDPVLRRDDEADTSRRGNFDELILKYAGKPR